MNNEGIQNPKFEQGLTDSFDKFPIWLRWVMFIPASIILYLLIYFLTYFSLYWLSGEKLVTGYLGQLYRDILFVVIPLFVIHECVPRFKFIIGIIFSSIYIVLGISVFAIELYTRPINMDIDFFFSLLLPDIITVAVAIVMIVIFTKHKLSTK